MLSFLITVAYACQQGETPKVRKEWREISETQRQDYIKAVLCLKNKRSKLKWSIGSPSRYDDFVYSHRQSAMETHNKPLFLPWHRAFLAAYESALENECNYTGGLPYWDWTLDSQAPDQAFIWNDNYFGGDGKGPNNCITGPFSNFKITFGKDKGKCLWRIFDTDIQENFTYWSPETVSSLMVEKRLWMFSGTFEAGPHGSIHQALGGCMQNVGSSANDPIFFLHHSNVDRFYTRWQELHPETAKTYDTLHDPKQVQIELNRVVEGPYEKLKISDVFNTTEIGTPLCYIYSNSVVPVSNATLVRRDQGNKLKCPTPLSEKMILENYGQESVSRIRELESKACNFTKFINTLPYQSIATLVKKNTRFRPATKQEVLSFLKSKIELVKQFFKRRQ